MLTTVLGIESSLPSIRSPCRHDEDDPPRLNTAPGLRATCAVIGTRAGWDRRPRDSGQPSLGPVCPLPPDPDDHRKHKYDTTAGEGTDIYILDDGIDGTHSEFNGRYIWHIDPRVPERMLPSNMGHGTAVAGVAAGQFCGVAKKANIIDVQIGANTSFVTTDILQGLDAVLERASRLNKQNRSVAIASWGKADCQAPVIDKFRELFMSSIPLVVAAGDDSVNSSGSCFDSMAHEYGFLVGAITHDYERWSWSNWGPAIDLFAPGFDIEVPLSHHDHRSRGKEFDEWVREFGTSLAAPFVGGTVAYLRAYDEDFRNASVSDLKTWMKYYATKDILTRIKDSPNNLLYTVIWGQ